MRMKKCEHQTCDEIVPCMREDAGSQTAAKENQQTEQRAEHRKQNHVARALISMRSAEEQARAHDPCSRSAPLPCPELTLQIPAKHNFLRYAGEDADKKPRGHF